MSKQELILHHYPPSPVSEKVRVAMGLKGLAWRSVEQNRLPDRPQLFDLTGGYRRIPVLQIGADIYCDTLCILREIDQRYPQPTFFPNNGAGLPYAVGRWMDGPMFDLAVRLAFAPSVDQLPGELVADRARLYLGPDGDFREEAKDLPHVLAQIRPQLGWLEERLAAGRTYVLGDAPGLPDLYIWYIVWFIRGRYGEKERLFAEFPNLSAWGDRMAAIGHGNPQPMAMDESYAIAGDAAPATPEAGDTHDPQGLAPGMSVSIVQVTDSGDPVVRGVVRAVDRDRIAILRESKGAGKVCVHFPRVGYRVTKT
jgi:glutathione S-transferase